MNSQKKHYLRRTYRPALIASLAVHAGAMIALAAFNPRLPHIESPALGEKAGETIELTATYGEREHPLVEMPSAESPILIMPQKAHFSGRWWIDTPAHLVDIEDLLSPETLEIVLAEEALETISIAVSEDNIQAHLEESPTTEEPIENPAPIKPSLTTKDKQAEIGSATTSRATFSNNRPPRYPAIALQRRWQGRVLLRLAFATDGRITEIEVIQSSGHPILDAAAVAAVRTWKGQAALRDGKPIASVEVLPVRFRLP